MIESRGEPSAGAFVRRLETSARRLAQLRGENRLRARRRDARRWRIARLLWPLF